MGTQALMWEGATVLDIKDAGVKSALWKQAKNGVVAQQ